MIENNKLMVSLYQDFKVNLGTMNIMDLFKEIKSDKYQSEINSIRYAVHSGKESLVDELKSKLIAFTTSGVFNESRTKVNLQTYSQIIGLDFDDIDVTEVQQLKANIDKSEYTLASFVSPSGEGVKAFVQVNSNAEHHTSTYNQVANYYQEITGYKFDAKCKDVTRLCFVSFDEHTFINEFATIYIPKIEEEVIPTKSELSTINFSDFDSVLDKCLKFTEQKEQYYKGNRNNFIYLFSSNANRFGIDRETTLEYCLSNFDLEEKEIKQTVYGVYRLQFADFAKFAKFAELQSPKELNPKEEVLSDDVLKNTPIIPQSVFDNLPLILFESCKAFKEPRERDTFLTGALAILSGCLPNVTGLYHGRIVYPNLFAFILAPAASGKGALTFSKALADKYHKNIVAKSYDARKEYEEKLAAYKMLKAKNKLESDQEMPAEPKFKVVYIPANTSNAKVIQHLECNDGNGIICETEADTLGYTFKNEWGSYSDMLRKGFHHEKVSVSRKTNAEFVEVNEPKLSLAITGTPKQIYNIIPSAEDGLFSRFVFYVFKTESVWLDPSPKGNPVNLTEFFDKQGTIVEKMVDFFETDKMVLHLTDEQWETFNDVFSSYLSQISILVSDEAQSVVKRLGLIFYRFCMILTAIRKFVTQEHTVDVYCLDEDYNSAKELISTYIQHSITMFNNLPKQEGISDFKKGNNKKQFLDALPSKFQRKDVIELAKKYDMGERTMDDFLKSCIGKYLVQPKTGFYEKIS